MRREQIYADNGFRREAEAPPPGRTGLTGAVSEMAGLGRRPRQVVLLAVVVGRLVVVRDAVDRPAEAPPPRPAARALEVVIILVVVVRRVGRRPR